MVPEVMLGFDMVKGGVFEEGPWCWGSFAGGYTLSEIWTEKRGAPCSWFVERERERAIGWMEKV